MEPRRLQETDLVHRDYKLLPRLGAGAFGAVYAAQNIPSGLLVAIKVVRADECAWVRTRKIREPMPQEYAALRRLEGHQGILRAHHYFYEGDSVYMVMEPHGSQWTKFDGGYTVQQYVQHANARPGDLASAMKAHALPVSEKGVFGIFSQIVSAVAHMHAHGVAHRDLKPANILIDRKRQVKLADFGLASFIEISSRYDDKEVGTDFYMAPEVHTKPIARYRLFPADIFALGMILLELVQLPGRPRIHEDGFPAVWRQHNHPSKSWPRRQWQDCRRLVSACSRYDPGRRPTAHDILRCKWFNSHHFLNL